MRTNAQFPAKTAPGPAQKLGKRDRPRLLATWKVDQDGSLMCRWEKATH